MTCGNLFASFKPPISPNGKGASVLPWCFLTTKRLCDAETYEQKEGRVLCFFFYAPQKRWRLFRAQTGALGKKKRVKKKKNALKTRQKARWRIGVKNAHRGYAPRVSKKTRKITFKKKKTRKERVKNALTRTGVKNALRFSLPSRGACRVLRGMWTSNLQAKKNRNPTKGAVAPVEPFQMPVRASW